MGDLISREAAIRAINAFDYRGLSLEDVRKVTDGCAAEVNKLPAEDAEPVRWGEWVHLGGDEWCCNWCGDVIHTEGSWEKPTKKYCSECGARMKEEGSV